MNFFKYLNFRVFLQLCLNYIFIYFLLPEVFRNYVFLVAGRIDLIFLPGARPKHAGKPTLLITHNSLYLFHILINIIKY